ncbi:MAG: hypothetical protein ABIJ47_05525 [Candidatus Bathyarchaeota archaeon]
MTETSELVDRVSKSLGVPPEELVAGGVKMYLRARLRMIQAELKDVENRYRVRSPCELEEKIKKGSVEEHPTWEDLIQYENLVEQAEKIRRELDSMPK